MILLDIAIFLLGLLLVIYTLGAVTRTFVLPRAASVKLSEFVFLAVRHLFNLRLRFTQNVLQQDQIQALYAPTALLITPIVWLTLIMIGYLGMFWAIGVRPLEKAFLLSGSSLLTLGFTPVETLAQTVLAFSEAMIGLGLIALLIAYLPTMYSAFSKRETAVALLEAYASSPPSAYELIARIYRIRGLDYMGELWANWEIWFAEIEESHSSLTPLIFFRSPTPERSWVTAAGTVLDAASSTVSTLDIPPDPRANLCIRSGYLALRQIAAFFRIPFDPDPRPGDPISISRQEYDQVYKRLAERGVPLKSDQDQGWKDFAGWRVNYDRVLLALAELTTAPQAPWTSDRPPLPYSGKSK